MQIDNTNSFFQLVARWRDVPHTDHVNIPDSKIRQKEVDDYSSEWKVLCHTFLQLNEMMAVLSETAFVWSINEACTRARIHTHTHTHTRTIAIGDMQRVAFRLKRR